MTESQIVHQLRSAYDGSKKEGDLKPILAMISPLGAVSADLEGRYALKSYAKPLAEVPKLVDALRSVLPEGGATGDSSIT